MKEEDTTWIGLGRFNPCNPIPKFCCLVNHRGRLIQSGPIQVASVVSANFFQGEGRNLENSCSPHTACYGILPAPATSLRFRFCWPLVVGRGGGIPYVRFLLALQKAKLLLYGKHLSLRYGLLEIWTFLTFLVSTPLQTGPCPLSTIYLGRSSKVSAVKCQSIQTIDSNSMLRPTSLLTRFSSSWKQSTT